VFLSRLTATIRQPDRDGRGVAYRPEDDAGLGDGITLASAVTLA
jgi:hypothetical protein